MNVVRVTKENYEQFSKMVYYRQHKKDGYGDSLELVMNELENPNLYVYALDLDGLYVGWISCVYIPKVSKWKGHGHVYVDELYVEDAYRHLGYAKALMAKADELCVNLNAHGVRLYVNIENDVAKQLYESCGYKMDGTAYFMEKNNESN